MKTVTLKVLLNVSFLSVTLSLMLSLALPSSASAVDADREAKRLLERISGTKVPASHPLLPRIKSNINANKWYEAAGVATEHPDFLNVTVKQMALKMSTREETIQTAFNDFAATFIGVVRDDRDARTLLTGNFQYIADVNKVPTGIMVRSEYNDHIVKSNTHFSDLENLNIPLNEVLKPIDGQLILQSRTNTVVYNPDPAGLLTSRAFISSHAVAGTNRRPVEFTFRQFMCSPIDDWADTTVSDSRIGRDIDRYPGGDHTKFQVSCKGCHTVMDGFRGAFSKWNFSNDFISNRDVQLNTNGTIVGGVEGKLNANTGVFPNGYVTTDNSFVNNARGPANEAKFGWRGNLDPGYGVKDFGQQIANSSRFSECMVKRVFDSACRKDISFEDKSSFLKYYARRFEDTGYSLKRLYQMVAVTEECVK